MKLSTLIPLTFAISLFSIRTIALPSHILAVIVHNFPHDQQDQVYSTMRKVNFYYAAYLSTLKACSDASFGYNQTLLETEKVRGNIANTLRCVFVGFEDENKKLVNKVKTWLEVGVLEAVVCPKATIGREMVKMSGPDLETAVACLKKEVDNFEEFITPRKGNSQIFLVLAQVRIDLLLYFFEKVGELLEKYKSIMMETLQGSFFRLLRVAHLKLYEVNMSLMAESYKKGVTRVALKASRFLVHANSCPYTSDKLPMYAIDQIDSKWSLYQFIFGLNEFVPITNSNPRANLPIKYLQTREYPALDFLNSIPAGPLPEPIMHILPLCKCPFAVHGLFVFANLHLQHLMLKRISKVPAFIDYKSLRTELHEDSDCFSSGIRERMAMCSLIGSIYHVDKTMMLSCYHNMIVEITGLKSLDPGTLTVISKTVVTSYFERKISELFVFRHRLGPDHPLFVASLWSFVSHYNAACHWQVLNYLEMRRTTIIYIITILV